jgi:hypothetical protein
MFPILSRYIVIGRCRGSVARWYTYFQTLKANFSKFWSGKMRPLGEVALWGLICPLGVNFAPKDLRDPNGEIES